VHNAHHAIFTGGSALKIKTLSQHLGNLSPENPSYRLAG
jgi:hypothetical protein